MLKHETLVFSI